MKSFFKKYKNYFLSFIIPFFICIIILWLKGIFQNIDRIYISDLSGQHLAFLNYLKGVMLGKNSIEYSYFAGMGCPMLATMIFYCVSPLNILLILINDIQWAIIIINILKVSLAGLTMFILLKSKMKRNNIMTVAFATGYAVSSFFINFFFCVFWFDSIYLAPLVMLGIDNIIKYEKINYLYIFSLALAIICNIQMGFGLCIYSVIYYLYLFNIKYSIFNDFNKFKKLSIIFIISSLCAGGVSSGILLGFLSEYRHIMNARGGLFFNDTPTSNIFYVIKNLFTVGFKSDTYYSSYEPYVSSGLIVSYFLILYFSNSRVSMKKKIHTIVVIMIFVISFSIRFLNSLWHITSPIILNYRYSIYLCLFLTTIAYESYVRKRKIRKNDIRVLVGALVVVFLVLLVFIKQVYVFYTSIFLILVFLFSVLSKNKNKKFEIVLFSVVIVEVVVSGYLSLFTSDSNPNEKKIKYNSMLKLTSYDDLPNDYRVFYNYSFSGYSNDGFLLNKNSSLRYFSSVIDGNLVGFLGANFSFKGFNNYRLSAYESPLLLSLLGNKYFYLTKELNNNGLYEKKKTYKVKEYDYKKKKTNYEKVYLYENLYALSVGYVIDKDVRFFPDMDAVDYQNSIIRGFTGIKKNVMIRLEWDYEQDLSECQPKYKGNCFVFYITNRTNNNLVYINRALEEYAFSKDYTAYFDESSLLLVSTLDEEIEFVAKSTYNINNNIFFASTYDKYQLIESLTALQDNMMYNVKVDKNVMSGEIDSNKDGMLFLSIPYDDRFKVYVDGKKVKYYSLLDDTFIGLDIKKGKHKVVLKYSDSGNYKWYILASVISIIITFVVKYSLNRFVLKCK